MSEQEARRSDPRGPSRERSKDDVLAAAQPLPPDEDVLIDDLTEDEDRLFVAAVLDARPRPSGLRQSSIPGCSLRA
jgi:hypothetical protein